MSPATDIVSLSGLHLATTVGPDQWHRTRPQPIHLTVHLHLTPSYLDTPGTSDHVTDSLHYGHLAKAVERRVSTRTESKEGGYASARALVEDVTDAAFVFVRDAVGGKRNVVGNEDGDGEVVIRAVHVVLELPKQILLAGGFEIELITRASDWVLRSAGSRSEKPGAIVRVTNLIFPVLIGVNPPERLRQTTRHYPSHFLRGPSPHQRRGTTRGWRGDRLSSGRPANRRGKSLVHSLRSSTNLLSIHPSIHTRRRTLKTRHISRSKTSFMKSSTRPIAHLTPTQNRAQTLLVSTPSPYAVKSQARSHLQTPPGSR
ncbi:hypothetical protein J3R83DRAFT_11532 [Lanmaoa asiatica]|nr:hypothetical protein J3R83DRAFT_11532 [Lanmaoa asiatica]